MRTVTAAASNHLGILFMIFLLQITSLSLQFGLRVLSWFRLRSGFSPERQHQQAGQAPVARPLVRRRADFDLAPSPPAAC